MKVKGDAKRLLRGDVGQYEQRSETTRVETAARREMLTAGRLVVVATEGEPG